MLERLLDPPEVVAVHARRLGARLGHQAASDIRGNLVGGEEVLLAPRGHHPAKRPKSEREDVAHERLHVARPHKLAALAVGGETGGR